MSATGLLPEIGGELADKKKYQAWIMECYAKSAHDFWPPGLRDQLVHVARPAAIPGFCATWTFE
jgi:hypothetical protein